MRGVPQAEIERRVDEALALVRLKGQEHKLPGQLSGGQQQRVAIARAIVIEPPLVLMDEPLSNLDAKLRLEMRAEIRRIHNMLGATTIYVTHDQDEALSLADRIVVLRDGVVRQVGTPEELYARPAHLDVAEFMGFRNRLTGHAWCRRDGGIATVDVGGRRSGRRGACARICSRATPAVVAVRPEDLHADGQHGRTRRRRSRSIEYPRPRVRRLRRRGRRRRSSPSASHQPLEPGATVASARRPASVSSIFRGDAGMNAAHARIIDAPAPARQGPSLAQRLAARGLDGADAAGRAGRALRARAVRLSVPVRALCCRSSRRRAARSPTTRASSPIRSSTRRSAPRCWLALPVTLLNVVARGADRVARAADAPPAAAHDDPGRADHARHRAGRRRAAELSRPAGLVQPHAARRSA